jgi:hypothetical protein
MGTIAINKAKGVLSKERKKNHGHKSWQKLRRVLSQEQKESRKIQYDTL